MIQSAWSTHGFANMDPLIQMAIEIQPRSEAPLQGPLPWLLWRILH
jgi:hypothetical protein